MMIPAFHPRDCRSPAAWAVCWMLLLALASPFAVASDAAIDLSTLERIEVQPQQLQLHRPRDRAIVLVTGYFPNGLGRRSYSPSANHVEPHPQLPRIKKGPFARQAMAIAK